MPQNTIAVQPLHGWRPTHNQSCVALEWRYYQEEKLRRNDHTPAAAAAAPHIAHAGNQGKRLLDRGPLKHFLVDGYVASTRTVYEFHGCFYNGFVTHFPNRMQNHPYHEGKTMHDVRQATTEQTQQLCQLGYHVIEMWTYQTHHGKTECKVREFTLNVRRQP